MTRSEFNTTYNPATRCHVTYSTPEGDVLRGLVLDGVQTSASGTPFIYVNNFATAIALANVKRIIDTGVEWTTRP